MTFREKYAFDTGEYSTRNDNTFGMGCPVQRRYENSTPPNCIEMSCAECWDREMPGTEPTECAKLPTDESISVVSSQTPAVNCANCEKLEAENKELAKKLAVEISVQKRLFDKLERYQLVFATIEATMKIKLPLVV